MPYAPDLNQIQLGKQTVFGTDVTATAKLPLVESVEFEAEEEVEQIKEVGKGSLAGAFTAVLNSHKAKASFGGVVSYEDNQYWLDSILALTTPTGAGPYVYAGQAPGSAVPTRRISTYVWGQTGMIYKLTGGIVNELTYTLESNKPWHWKANIFGKSISPGSLAALSDRSVTWVHANVSSLFIDAWGGTMGATAIATTFFSAELSIKSNADNVMGIGSLTPLTYYDAAYEASLKLHLEVDAITAGYVSTLLASLLQHQVRLKATTGANQILQLDFAGTHTKVPKDFSDKDGVVTFEFEMDRTYNPTLGNFFKWSNTNGVSVLP